MAAKKKVKAGKKKVFKKVGAKKTAAKKTTGAAAGTDPKRVAAILAGLDAAYPDATCELNYSNAFQLLIATILSAQCTDVRINQVTSELFKKYTKPEDFVYASPAELEKEIRPTGFFRNKTKSIMGAGKKILEEFKGEVPRTMEQLLTLPGVARKTANVVSAERGHAEGIVVDTHVRRLSQRLGFTRQEDPVQIERDLMKLVPRPDWARFPHLLIWHGRRVCDARRPDCEGCVLSDLCPSSRV
jgi:endonuclease-3